MKLTPKQVRKIQKIAGDWLSFLYSSKLPYIKENIFSYWINGGVRAQVSYDWVQKKWKIKVQNLEGESSSLDI